MTINGLALFATFAVIGAAWWLTKPQDQRRGPSTWDPSPRELLAVLPTAALAAVIAMGLVAGVLLVGPHS